MCKYVNHSQQDPRSQILGVLRRIFPLRSVCKTFLLLIPRRVFNMTILSDAQNVSYATCKIRLYHEIHYKHNLISCKVNLPKQHFKRIIMYKKHLNICISIILITYLPWLLIVVSELPYRSNYYSLNIWNMILMWIESKRSHVFIVKWK